jgi:hypothetical protein
MKVLYLWNTAGVFTPVAEWLIDNGHDAKIVARYNFDIYEHTQNSRAAVMVDSSGDFFRMGIKLIRKWKPDIIHISGTLKMLVIARAFAPRGTIVFSYHGSDARNPTGKPHVETKLADFVHVSTPDLAPYGKWIDRPIDPMFHYRGNREPRTALMFYKSHFYKDNRDLASDWCKTRGYTLTIIDEDHPDFPIPNDQMPELFSKHEYYLDWKDQKGDRQAFSKTALEALACGCKVVHDSDLEHVFSKTDEEWKWATPVDYYNLYAFCIMARSTKRVIKRLPRLLWELAKFVKRRYL